MSNMTNIIKLASEIKELRDKADALEAVLQREVQSLKVIIPTDKAKIKENHERKFAPQPPGFFHAGANISLYGNSGYNNHLVFRDTPYTP